MRSLRTVLVVALALGGAVVALAQKPQEKPVPPAPEQKEGVVPGLAKKSTLPPGLAKRFGDEVPEEAWIAFHPTRDDGAWFLIDFEWTLVTGFSPSTRAEVKEARKLPSRTPPLPPPNVGVTLHVVRFEKP
jgi:hypothetical protein